MIVSPVSVRFSSSTIIEEISAVLGPFVTSLSQVVSRRVPFHPRFFCIRFYLSGLALEVSMKIE